MRDLSELDFINHFSQVYYTVDLSKKNPRAEFYSSRRMAEQLGLDEVSLDDPDYLRGLILKEDKPLRKRFQKEIEDTGNGGVVRYRIKNGYGKLFWMEEEVQILSREDGRPQHLVGLIRDITENQLVLKQLVRNREKLALTLKASGLGAWDFNLETGKFFPDGSWEHLTGYKSPSKGLPLKELLTYIYFEDRNLIVHSFFHHIKGESDSFQALVRFSHKSKGWIWIQVSGRILSYTKQDRPNRITGVFQDISYSRRMETGFNEKLRIEMSISSILTRLNRGGDLNGTIHDSLKRIASHVRADRTYLCIQNTPRGIQSPSLKDRSFFLWSEDIKLKDKEALKELFMPGDSSLIKFISTGRPVIVQDINNLTFHLEHEENLFKELNIKAFIIIPLFQDNNLTGFLGVEDIKGPREWEEQEIYFLSVVSSMIAAAIRRIRMNDELVQARDRAEQASLVKSSFIANMSHEFRTPLNAIIGFSDLLQSEISDPVLAHHLKTIKTSGQSLLHLMNDILDISKIEAGKLDVVKYEVHLSNLISEITSLFQMQAEKKAVILKSIIDPRVPPVLLLDKTRVRQILLNLVGNAVKFTDDGEILVDVSCEEGESPDEVTLFIAIEDSGIGISEEDQRVIFESFVQQADSTEKRFQGVGLGLSISRRLAHILGGEISVNSRPGYGSRFQLELKHVGIGQSEFLTTDSQVYNEFTQFESSLILVVDDNIINTRLVEEILKKLNLKTIKAHNGQEAMDMALIHFPDLIIMDIRMPVMDGITASQHLKKNKKTSSIPIIALTAYQSPEDLNINKDLFADYLTKPVGIHPLSRALLPFLAKVEGDSSVEYRKNKKKNSPADLIQKLDFEKYGDLLEKMREEIQPLLQQCLSMIVMSDLNDITETLDYLGKTYKYQELRTLSQSFQEIIDIFDIENIEKIIELLNNAITET